MLPALPKKNNKKEADFGLKFREWILSHSPKMPTGTYELKDSNGKEYINFKEITDDQIASAERTQTDKGNLLRIVNGTPGAPDYVFFRNSPAFFVIKFPGSFEVISLGNLLAEKESGKRKSLTVKRAKDISILSVGCK